jgi:hypothetical protein
MKHGMRNANPRKDGITRIRPRRGERTAGLSEFGITSAVHHNAVLDRRKQAKPSLNGRSGPILQTRRDFLVGKRFGAGTTLHGTDLSLLPERGAQ